MQIKTFFTAEELQQDVAFSDNDLSSAMMRQAGLYARYSAVAAQASKQVDDAKLIRDIVEAKLDKQLRDEAAKAGEKTTEPGIAKAVLRTKDMIVAIQSVNQAKMVESLAKNALEAFTQRRDMLIQIGVQAREEMKGQIRVAGNNLDLEAQRARVLEKVKAA